MFSFTSPHQVRRSDGSVATVTVPVEFPRRILADGLLYTFERQGYSSHGVPAGYYTADDGSALWLCDGDACRA